ncbi:hypothetical protein ES708_18719 [subsurface metagenome]
MKKLIILIEIITIILLLYVALTKTEAKEPKYFIMTVTAYSLHPDCIADKWNDGYTSTMTPIREGVAAINVDYIDGEWVVRSPLKLGDQIYIEEMGYYSVEDTGYFTDKDFKQDFWNVDVFEPNPEKAVKAGRKVKRVYVIERKL